MYRAGKQNIESVGLSTVIKKTMDDDARPTKS